MKSLILSFVLIFVFSLNSFAKIRVVTTTFIISSIVKQVGGEYVDADYLIPSGANPHIFSPKPRSLSKLLSCDMYVGVGYGFEFWINRFENILNKKNVLMMSDYYKHPMDFRMVGGKETANPHIWLDLDFMADIFVFKIADGLCGLDRNHCEYFQKNAKNLSKDVKHIKIRYIKAFKGINDCCFLDIKPAFEYFLKSIGIRTCYVLIKKGNKEPKIRDISNAVKKCKCKHGVVVYINSIQVADMISQKLGYVSVMLNSLGSPKKLNSYTKLILYNLNKIENAINNDNR